VKLKLEQFELPGSILKVKLTGPIDIWGANEIDMPFSVIGGSRKKVVVDFSGVSFLASIGIRVLVMTARAISSKGGRLVIYSPTDEARRVLGATGIDKIIPVAADETTAVAMFV
jgi:anti-sigma B factor antagonist